MKNTIANRTRDKIFLKMLSDAGLPEPTAEFRFHPKRKWRFDFAFIENRIAVEIEGGVWNKGAHVRPVHFLSDMEKYNEAAILGWKVLRFESNNLIKLPAIQLIKRAFENIKKDYIVNERLLWEKKSNNNVAGASGNWKILICIMNWFTAGLVWRK